MNRHYRKLAAVAALIALGAALFAVLPSGSAQQYLGLCGGGGWGNNIRQTMEPGDTCLIQYPAEYSRLETPSSNNNAVQSVTWTKPQATVTARGLGTSSVQITHHPVSGPSTIVYTLWVTVAWPSCESNTTLRYGRACTYTAAANDTSNASSATAVATVARSGTTATITAVGVGTATVTRTASGGTTTTYTITVIGAPSRGVVSGECSTSAAKRTILASAVTSCRIIASGYPSSASAPTISALPAAPLSISAPVRATISGSNPSRDRFTWTVTRGSGVGDAAVSIAGLSGISWYFTSARPAQTLMIHLRDSDGIVAAGADLPAELGLTLESVPSGNRDFLTEYIRLSGGLLGGCETTPADTCGTTYDIRVTPNTTADTTRGVKPFTINIPAGTPSGKYTASARVSRTVGSGASAVTTTFNATRVFTVGDIGRNIGSASLSLARTVPSTAAGNVDGMRHAHGESNSMPETTSAAAGQSIFLRAAIKNSLGNRANAWPAISELTISAPGGTIRLHSSAGTVISTLAARASAFTLPARSGNVVTLPDAVHDFSVTRATPGSVDVSVTAVGPDGLARSEVITLTFTGPPSKLTLTPNERTLLNHYRDGSAAADPRDDLSFTLAATDKAGNTVNPGSGAVTITDPDGNRVEANKLTSAITVSGGRTLIPIAVASGVSPASPLKSGEYTIAIAASSTLKASAKFTVVGPAAALALAADDQTPSKVGQVVTVTATVADAAGNQAADGTMVSFAAAGANAGVTVATRIGSTGPVAAKNGQAAARFVIAASGAAVITAAADNASNTIVLTSRAGAPVVEDPVEIHGAAGLASARLNSFTTWTAPNPTTAAELFRSLIGRGASSLQLWDGSQWLRYSIVNGVMVPGSVDFTIEPGDVVYISG